MKLLAIVGTNAPLSYNRKLLMYMQKHFAKQATIEIAEVKDIPLFNEEIATDTPPAVEKMRQKIEAADGVIFGVPEYDHRIPAALKSVLEWLSYQHHPFRSKPCMLVGDFIRSTRNFTRTR